MKFYLCIDDTDNLDSIGTGTIAEQIQEKIIRQGYGPCCLVTRHQLYIHEDIPYTSHNSSMCFYGEAPDDALATIIDLAAKHLDTVAAVGSDPGLCVLAYDESCHYDELMEFGIQAKQTILTKDDAMACARNHQLHLSEHGGTGQGIIGALAGVGLRLFGCDGEIKGALKNAVINQSYTVADLKNLPEVEQVLDLTSKEPLADTTLIRLDNRSKTVLYRHHYVLFVRQDKNNQYVTIPKAEIRQLGEHFYV
ncbi:Uncharacterised protein [Acetobacterium wieringae]|uniref:hypothetical protein n=1 Tax=Acetobacterium wieringae TaxID=52694 RepID=UPI001D3B418E|nr:hypothetical protein [Acetobacterium wieringae]VUZ28280.1 Uncharacterised protein [Acetobacterium wieringae]